MRPLPRQQAPDLSINILRNELWTLSDQKPEAFTMIVFYRGLHCPVCKKYLKGLQEVLPEYEARGVEVLAISMDSEVRARKTAADWKMDKLKIGYGLKEEAARSWGLYMSKGIKEGEPDMFSEPGMFLVKPDNEIYYVAINSAPWGRPDLDAFVKKIDFIEKENYPARGEVEA